MPPPQGSAASGLSGFKIFVLMLAVFVAAYYVIGPSVSWPIVKEAMESSPTCPPCSCECLSDSESALLPGVVNTPSLDCEKADPLLKEDLDKTSVELLSEELKLQESVAGETQRHAESALLDAKKLSSQYQKEAEKCNAGMETCEEAREKSEAALLAQKKVSAMWEMRARELGWRDKTDRQSLFSRIRLTSDDGQSNSFFNAGK